MNLSDAFTSERKGIAAGKRRAILLTSYNTGAAHGKNMGVVGYSYDVVARLYLPLLRQWGEVVEVPRSIDELERAAQAVRRRNLEPIHVSFLPFHDVCLAPSAPNVVVPAWEFPDVPDHEFGDNPQNNWVTTANRCDLIIVGGPWTAANFRKAGIRVPIQIVQVPSPDEYFHLPAWEPDGPATIECQPFVFSHIDKAPAEAHHHAVVATVNHRQWKRKMATAARRAYQRCARPILPPLLDRALTTLANSPSKSASACPPSPRLELSGIVYTSIFNPVDGRKNWDDLLTGFLQAFRDCPDATLVMKLISRDPAWVGSVLDRYRSLDVAHRCKLAFVTDYLTNAQMLELAQATTYYITTTKAEGNCLPVMNYLAAGRPCLSTCHTAISDYFSENIGFIIDSHAEPAGWPQDLKWRWRTTSQRIVWTSVVEQLRQSYDLVKQDRDEYAALAKRARREMREWAHPESVGPRLWAALDSLSPSNVFARAA